MAHGPLYLPSTYSGSKTKARSSPIWTVAVLALLATSVILVSWTSILTDKPGRPGACSHKGTMACEQAEPRMPRGYNVSKILGEKDRIIGLLSGAVSLFANQAWAGKLIWRTAFSFQFWLACFWIGSFRCGSQRRSTTRWARSTRIRGGGSWATSTSVRLSRPFLQQRAESSRSRGEFPLDVCLRDVLNMFATGADADAHPCLQP